MYGRISQLATGLLLDNNPNLVLNGGFDLWPQGTSFSSIASGTFSADNWVYLKSGAMVNNIVQAADVPTVSTFSGRGNYSIQVQTATADTSLAGGDITYLETRMEGYNIQNIHQRSSALSFWVKAAKTGTHSVALSNSGSDRFCAMPYTIQASNAWEYKEVVFPAPPTAGTWNYLNGTGLRLIFLIAAETGFLGTGNQWNSSPTYGVTGTVNEVDTIGNNFQLWGVNLIQGTKPRPYLARLFSIEEMLAQRYFWRFTPPANIIHAIATPSSTTVARWPIYFPTTMRIGPSGSVSASGDFSFTVDFSTISTGTPVANSGSGPNVAGMSVSALSPTVTAGQALAVRTASGYYEFNARLT